MKKRDNSLGWHIRAAWAVLLLTCIAFGDNFVSKALGLPQPQASERLGTSPERVGRNQVDPQRKDDYHTRPDEQGLPAQP